MPDCLIQPLPGQPSIPVRAVSAADLDSVLASLGPAARNWASSARFTAAAGSVLSVPDADGAVSSVLFGLGDTESQEPWSALLAGRLATELPPGTYRLAEGFPDPAAAALAFALGAYRFTRYRKSGEGPKLVLPEGNDGARTTAMADAVWLVRDLINTGPNDMGPAELANAARDLAERHDAVFTETVGGALLSANFPMIHAVGIAASPSRAPRLLDMSWGEPTHPKITLVGKGVCFDTGGLDIKSSSGMLLMKKDMAGAASALGLAHMIMATRLPVRLRVLIPAVENAISSASFRPGDVLASRLGLTVEIGNTDAEGRLVLADALALACEETPDLLIDFATLTGAARTALGPEVVPFYSSDDKVAEELAIASREASDPLWRLPLWPPYLRMLDSKVADINNAGSTPFAGSITAALFLSRFVAPGVPWLHADIYGWNPAPRPGRPEGGEAQTIRALFTMLGKRYASA